MVAKSTTTAANAAAPEFATETPEQVRQQGQQLINAAAQQMNPAVIAGKEQAMGHIMRTVFDKATTVMAWVGGIGTITGGVMMYRNRNNGGNGANAGGR